MLNRLSKDDLCAAASGLLLALSFPAPGWWGLAWFALVPWLLTLQRRPFRSGLIAGGVFFALLLYWLNIVMTRYGGLNLPLSLVAYLLLVLYLAVFFSAAAGVAVRFQQQLKLPLWAGFSLTWVAAEYARSHLLTGFPWGSIGYSQQGFLPFIQTADIWGVAGVGLLVVLVNLLLTCCWRAVAARSGPVAVGLPLFCVLLILTGNFQYGRERLQQLAALPPENPLTVAVTQGNIEQGVKWEPAYLQNTLRRYAELTRVATADPVDLVIWPESATPFFFQEASPARDFVLEVVRDSGSALLFGSPAYERVDSGLEYYNSAFLLSPEGRLLGRSDKVHLVPFGEYVPLKWLLPFIDKLVVGIGDFSPGRLQPISLDGTQLGVLVCYEVIFPALARTYALRGADLLVNITNDAWFGESAAPYQHLAMTSLRAVENRIWVARAANTGISAFVAPTGEVLSPTGLFKSAVRIRELDARANPGLFTRYGDLLPRVCSGLVLALFAATVWRKKSKVFSS